MLHALLTKLRGDGMMRISPKFHRIHDRALTFLVVVSGILVLGPVQLMIVMIVLQGG